MCFDFAWAAAILVYATPVWAFGSRMFPLRRHTAVFADRRTVKGIWGVFSSFGFRFLSLSDDQRAL